MTEQQIIDLLNERAKMWLHKNQKITADANYYQNQYIYSEAYATAEIWREIQYLLHRMGRGNPNIIYNEGPQ